MSEPVIYEHYFHILEVDTDASFSEVRASYLHLKELYSSNSPLFHMAVPGIKPSKQKEILSRIKEAYRALKDYFRIDIKEKIETKKEGFPLQRIPEFESYSGNALRLIREVLGIELEEVAISTGIPHKHLQHIEGERFDQLPPSGYVRAYVKKYAQYLELDADQILNDYMERYRKKQGKNSDYSF